MSGLDAKGEHTDREVRRDLERVQAQEKADAQRRQRELQAIRKRERDHQRWQKTQADMIDFHTKDAAWIDGVPEAPTFRPTVEQFIDPLAYIRSIQQEAAKSGICKIVPPVSAVIPGGTVLSAVDGKRGFRFTARQQLLAEPDRSSFDAMNPFSDGTRKYTVGEFEKMADEFAKKRLGSAGTLPQRMVEAEYWRARTESSDETFVEYGNDVEGSAFTSPSSTDPLGSSRWNLQKLPIDKESVLRMLETDIPGVSSPMLYLGMLFSTFAWHVEDHYLYSINYQHLGASKTWYGVPASDADSFEKAALEQVYAPAISAAIAAGSSEAEARDEALRHMLRKTTMFSPRILLDYGVKVCRAVQSPGDIIVTFPRAYHGGFSNGFCIGEAANFGMAEWFAYASDARARYQALRRPPILPYEALLVEHANLLKDVKKGTDDRAVPAGIAQRSFVRHMRKLNAAHTSLAKRGATMQLMPNADSFVLCARCRDVCRMALVVLPPSSETVLPASSGNAVVAPTSAGAPAALGAAAGSAAVQAAVAVQAAIAAAVPQAAAASGSGSDALGACAAAPQQLSITEIVGLECAEAAGAGQGATVFVHSQLAAFEALAMRLEQDPDAAIHGTAAGVGLGGLSEAALAPLEPYQWQQLPQPTANALESCDINPEALWRLEAALAQPPAQAKSASNGDAAAAPPAADSQPRAVATPAAIRKDSRNGLSQTPSPMPMPHPAPAADLAAMLATSNGFPAAELAAALARPISNHGGAAPAESGRSDEDALTYSGGDTENKAATPQQTGNSAAALGTSDRGGARHSTRKRKPTPAMQAAALEELNESRALKSRRPSTAAATAASESARAAAAANAAAAAARWDRQPPTFERSAWDERALLNTPGEALICVEDRVVDLGEASPGASVRRRIFSPPKSPDERYLLAREVVKASGVDYNTSAPNVVQRWFRAIMRRAKAHGLPLPSLPRRALLADVSHSRGCGAAAGVDVLSAEEVMMVAWVVDAAARARLAAFTAEAWPGLPNLLASHHLQGLLRLDAGAAPGMLEPGASPSSSAPHQSAFTPPGLGSTSKPAAGSAPMLASPQGGLMPGSMQGVNPDVASLMGQGLTSATLAAILQQQAHRMPADMSAYLGSMLTQLQAAEAIKPDPGQLAALAAASAGNLDPATLQALQGAVPSPLSGGAPGRDLLAALRQQQDAGSGGSPSQSGRPASSSAFRPAASRGNAEALLARLAGGEGSSSSDAAAQLQAMMTSPGGGLQPAASSSFQHSVSAAQFQPPQGSGFTASLSPMGLSQAPVHFPRVERPSVSRAGSLGLGPATAAGFGLLPVTSGGTIWDSGAPANGTTGR